jgi:tripartite-type tricarboxylate transporter receptor subunit TctC
MIRLAVVLLAAVLAAGTACAQSGDGAWPNRPVHFIVPFPAGGSTDTVARLVGQLLSQRLGQQFVIENRVGASGNLGTEAVARAAPDGYTIGLATTTTLALAPLFFKNLPFDPLKDFAPVSMLGSSPFVMVVPPTLPVKDLGEFIALARSKPDAMSYGSAGAGSLAHLAAALFANMGA